MKTTTILIPNGPTPAKMVDANYKVTLNMGYSETTLLVNALRASLDTYRELPVALVTPEVTKAVRSIIASLRTAIKALDVQPLIEAGDLKVGTAYVQDADASYCVSPVSTH
jgi:hypothetical protein